jgi:hypothetical protein
MPIPLKRLSKEAIPRAQERAERYRLLNEPVQAESICLDILEVDPQDQLALVTLLLAITDQFGQGYKLSKIHPDEVIARLHSEYARKYYAGIVAERRAKAILDQDSPQAAFLAHDYLSIAMRHYDEAAAIRPPGNDDALLRWNTCARLIDSYGVQPRVNESDSQLLE